MTTDCAMSEKRVVVVVGVLGWFVRSFMMIIIIIEKTAKQAQTTRKKCCRERERV